MQNHIEFFTLFNNYMYMYVCNMFAVEAVRSVDVYFDNIF